MPNFMLHRICVPDSWGERGEFEAKRDKGRGSWI
jgi:hypothetical protein